VQARTGRRLCRGGGDHLAPGAKITGLYHLDSLRCVRTGNLTYPLRYMPSRACQQIYRWDQVLMYADQPSPRAELFGVGECAARARLQDDRQARRDGAAGV
jgi:hypothetical protein